MKDKQLYATLEKMNFMIQEIYNYMIEIQENNQIKEKEEKLKKMQEEIKWLNRDIAYQSDRILTKKDKPNKVFDEYINFFEENERMGKRENNE